MNKYQSLIIKFVKTFKAKALNVKQSCNDNKLKDEKEYCDGLLLGYYEILSTMRNMLWSFQIPFEEVCFDIDPDKNLLGSTWKGEYKKFANHDKDTFKYFLDDYVSDIIKNSIRSKFDFTNSVKTEEKIFHKGRLRAYYEIVSVILKETKSFELNLKELGLDKINPDKDLV